MLQNSFIPHLLATGLPTHTQWFIQDGACPHTANVVYNFLYENRRVMSHRFPERHEGGKLWPPYSPDINPYDFILLGFFERESVSMEAIKCSAVQGPLSEVVPRAF
jgi:hypothetical protein